MKEREVYPNDAGIHETALMKTEVMEKMTAIEHMKMFYKFLFEKGEKVPVIELPQEKVEIDSLFADDGDGVKSAWLGHSSILMRIDGHTLLTDPVLERKVSLVGPTRFHRHLPLSAEALPEVDLVIISHDHYDHLNKYSITAIKDKVGKFIVPTGVGAHLRKWGVKDEQLVELGWWQEYRTDNGLTIIATPAQHFSGRGVFDRNATLWASWVIASTKHRLFFSGDSGYFQGFKEIGQKFGPFDLAFLECGAYDRRWSKVHMHPEQTAQAAIDLGARRMQPIHWATFNLALHPWYEPVERVIAEAWSRNVELVVPRIGELVDLARLQPVELWWVPAMVQTRKNSAETKRVADLYQN